MNPLWLFLIIPLSASAGAFCMALVAVNNRRQCEDCHTRCKDCAWFVPTESIPEAARMHHVMQDAFGDILPTREGKVGICRKVTFSAERPVITNENGYCHRAEKKKE